MPRPAAIERLLAAAAQDDDVLAVVLFGSTARGERGPASDVDICLVMRRDPAKGATETRIDYVGRFDLDVQVFQRLPLPVRRRVLKEGRVLLSKDDDALYRLAARTAQEFEDFRPAYQQYLSAVSHGGS